MYQTKIGYVFCIALLLLFAGCGKEEPAENISGSSSEITKTPEQNQTQDQTDLTGTPDVPEMSGESEKSETRVEMELVEYTYPFYELWCAGIGEKSFGVTDDGAYRIIFSDRYNKMIFALPEGINMALCDHVTVKARSEYGRFGAYLCDKGVYIDPWDLEAEVYCEYDLGGEGIRDYSFYPNLACDVWGVGIAAMDEVEDFSKYAVDVYSVTFHMKAESQK